MLFRSGARPLVDARALAGARALVGARPLAYSRPLVDARPLEDARPLVKMTSQYHAEFIPQTTEKNKLCRELGENQKIFKFHQI